MSRFGRRPGAKLSRAAHARRRAEPQRHLAGEQHCQLGPRAARSAHGSGRRARRGVQHSAAASAWSKATRSLTCRRRSRSATQNRADWVKLDPEVKCYMPGIPRATYMPYPFQIVQSKDNVLFTYEFTSASRIVRMNTRGEEPGAGVDGMVARQVGRRIAGDRGDRSHARHLVRSRRQLSQRRAEGDRALHADRRQHAATTKRRSKIRTCSRSRGRSRCRSIGAASRTCS